MPGVNASIIILVKDVEQLGEILCKKIFITEVNALIIIWVECEIQQGRTLIMVGYER